MAAGNRRSRTGAPPPDTAQAGGRERARTRRATRACWSSCACSTWWISSTSCPPGTTERGRRAGPRGPRTRAPAPSPRAARPRGPDRRTEADHHLVAARPQPARPALGPVAARRHRVVGAADVDRHDVDAVVGGDHGGAGAHLADLPVARARPLGEHQQIPAAVDEAVDVVGGAVVEPAAVAAERHRVEEQRDAVGLPAAVVEVVGRRGHGGAAAPLEAGSRAGSSGCRGGSSGWPRRRPAA